MWTAHPLRERPGRAMLAIAAVLVCGLMVATSFQDPLTGMLTGGGAMVVLLLSLNRFFLPSSFAIDEDGITAAWPLKRQRLVWTDLHGFAHDADGGYLSKAARPSKWDAMLRNNGMHVLFGTHGASIADRIRVYMPTGHGVTA
jgi:hypothetical protein